jgi:hypothetical protein
MLESELESESDADDMFVQIGTARLSSERGLKIPKGRECELDGDDVFIDKKDGIFVPLYSVHFGSRCGCKGELC